MEAQFCSLVAIVGIPIGKRRFRGQGVARAHSSFICDLSRRFVSDDNLTGLLRSCGYDAGAVRGAQQRLDLRHRV